MRTIKFRGKDLNGKWHYGDLLNMTEKDEETGELIKGCAIVSLGVNETIENPREGVAVEIYESEIVIVGPRTVGQFTGITDKNGVEIYEGDKVKKRILSGCGYDSDNIVVYREIGSFSLVNENSVYNTYSTFATQKAWNDGQCHGVNTYEFEVTGNIHDK